jgi:hypothetical protein
MPVPTTVIPLPVLVPEQQRFDPFIPTVYGNVDYRNWQSQLVRIDEILRTGMVEANFQRSHRAPNIPHTAPASERRWARTWTGRVVGERHPEANVMAAVAAEWNGWACGLPCFKNVPESHHRHHCKQTSLRAAFLC